MVILFFSLIGFASAESFDWPMDVYPIALNKLVDFADIEGAKLIGASVANDGSGVLVFEDEKGPFTIAFGPNGKHVYAVPYDIAKKAYKNICFVQKLCTKNPYFNGM
jgi:hypothetical protein